MYAPAGPALPTSPNNVPRSIPSPFLVDAGWTSVGAATPGAQHATGTSRLPHAQPVYHQSPQRPHRCPYCTPPPLRRCLDGSWVRGANGRDAPPPKPPYAAAPVGRLPPRRGAQGAPPLPVAHRRTKGHRRCHARARPRVRPNCRAHGRARGGRATGVGRAGPSGGVAGPQLCRATAENASGCALWADRRPDCCVKRRPDCCVKRPPARSVAGGQSDNAPRPRPVEVRGGTTAHVQAPHTVEVRGAPSSLLVDGTTCANNVGEPSRRACRRSQVGVPSPFFPPPDGARVHCAHAMIPHTAGAS